MEEKAIQGAISNAIEKAWGTAFSQNITRKITEKTVNGNVEINREFSNEATINTFAYFRIIGEPEISKEARDDEFIIIARVRGEACKKNEISSITINLLKEKDRESQYPIDGRYYVINNNSPINIYFKSSVDGYINIFYMEEEKKNIDIITPNRGMDIRSDGNSSVSRNESYFLGYNDNFEYVAQLATNREQQIDKIYIVYSKSKFPLPTFNDDREPVKIRKEEFLEALDRWKQNENFQVNEILLNSRVIA